MIETQIAVIAGALIGVALCVWARPLARVIPAAALIVVVISLFTDSPIPAPVQMALIGAGMVCAIVAMLGRGKSS